MVFLRGAAAGGLVTRDWSRDVLRLGAAAGFCMLCSHPPDCFRME
jgi:hypothetical protein